jgi:hypothetical protein
MSNYRFQLWFKRRRKNNADLALSRGKKDEEEKINSFKRLTVAD